MWCFKNIVLLHLHQWCQLLIPWNILISLKLRKDKVIRNEWTKKQPNTVSGPLLPCSHPSLALQKWVKAGETHRRFWGYQLGNAGLADFGCQCCHLIGKGDQGLGMCDRGFPCLVESYRPLGLGNRMTGQLILGPWGLFEHQGGSTWGGNRARLHLCVLHRGTSSLTSPVDPTWPLPPHIAIASRDSANIGC